MLIILSSAKTLKFDTQITLPNQTQPIFSQESESLVTTLQDFSEQQLEKLLKVSSSLASLNYQRFQQFNQAPKQAALLAYRGDVFKQLALSNFQERDYQFAQEHLRIISGLYGVLRPLDAIKPYRLEMNTRLSTEQNPNLYQFWTDKITKQIKEELALHSSKILLNLASDEYARVVNSRQLNYPILKISFKVRKDGQLKTIGIIAKKHRGIMTNWIIREQIDEPNQLKSYSQLGYVFSEQLSTEWEYIFIQQ